MKRYSKFFLLSTVIVILVISLMSMLACEKSADQRPNAELNSENIEDSGNDIPEIQLHPSNRKIIYTVDVYLTVKDLEKESQAVFDAVYENEEDENWISSDTINSYYSNQTRVITIRVKTEKLNDFLKKINEIGVVDSHKLETVDITTSYAQLQSQKTALEDELEYYQQLRNAIEVEDILAVPDGYKMLTQLITQITDTQSRLKFITDEIVKFDTDVEYSTVNLNIAASKKVESKTSFGSRVKSAFKNSFVIVWEAIKWLVVVLIYIIPSAIIITGVTVGVLFLNKKIKFWKKAKKDNVNTPSKDDHDKQ